MNRKNSPAEEETIAAVVAKVPVPPEIAATRAELTELEREKAALRSERDRLIELGAAAAVTAPVNLTPEERIEAFRALRAVEDELTKLQEREQATRTKLSVARSQHRHNLTVKLGPRRLAAAKAVREHWVALLEAWQAADEIDQKLAALDPPFALELPSDARH
jgi:DNA repair exonuclease SbcCD ATPase subunit